MNAEYLLLLLAFPLAFPFIMKRVFQSTINWPEMALQIVIPTILIGIIYLIGGYGATADVQLLNGQVTAKNRDHGSYVRTYDCMCYESCSGSGDSRSCHQVCQTCYEDHYTVHWYLSTTVGNIRLKYRDSTSRRVYNEADPPQYTAAYVSEPCSVENSYTNYIKAVPESIFSLTEGSTALAFEGLIPAYPRVHSYYKVNRVVSMGVPIPDIEEWNLRLSNTLRLLGPEKQANIILVLVNSADQTYRHALEESWLGGKKNDIIVTIGVSNYPTIDWVDTITLGANAGNSLMTVEMRDNLMNIGSVESSMPIINQIAITVEDKFDRKAMADYEYLKDEIDPPLWVIITALILGIGGSLLLTFIFHRNDFFENRYRRY